MSYQSAQRQLRSEVDASYDKAILQAATKRRAEQSRLSAYHQAQTAVFQRQMRDSAQRELEGTAPEAVFSEHSLQQSKPNAYRRLSDIITTIFGPHTVETAEEARDRLEKQYDLIPQQTPYLDPSTLLHATVPSQSIWRHDIGRVGPEPVHRIPIREVQEEGKLSYTRVNKEDPGLYAPVQICYNRNHYYTYTPPAKNSRHYMFQEYKNGVKVGQDRPADIYFDTDRLKSTHPETKQKLYNGLWYVAYPPRRAVGPGINPDRPFIILRYRNEHHVAWLEHRRPS